jgi:predicted PurR-regulated permease PerM
VINSVLTSAAIGNSATTFLVFLGAVNAFLLDLLFVLLIAFYMTLDGARLVRRMLLYLPPDAGEIGRTIRAILNDKFGGYLRGQALLAASYGVLTWIIVLLFGVPYTVVIAVFAAVMMLVPFIGTFLAIAPALLGYLLVHATDPSFPWLGLVLLGLVLGAAQHVVINLMAPRVMGGAMNMHPLEVLVGLLLGAEFAGLWGAIFGVPIFGALLDTCAFIYRRSMARRHGAYPPAPTMTDREAPHNMPPSTPPPAGEAGAQRAPGRASEREI